MYSEESGGDEGWFEVEKVEERLMPHAHVQGRMVPQFLYRMVKRVAERKKEG